MSEDQCLRCDFPLHEEEGEICDLCLDEESDENFYYDYDYDDDDYEV